MSPIRWAVRPLRKYANFSDRAPRAEYWWFVLLQMIVLGLPLAGLFATVGGGENLFGLGRGMLAAMALIGLALLVPNLAVQVRRLHDQDRSGWFILLGFIPYIGGLIMLVFMCIEGTNGSNRFGRDPYEASRPRRAYI